MLLCLVWHAIISVACNTKAALINIFMLTMDQMTMCVAHIDEHTEIHYPTLSSTFILLFFLYNYYLVVVFFWLTNSALINPRMEQKQSDKLTVTHMLRTKLQTDKVSNS